MTKYEFEWVAFVIETYLVICYQFVEGSDIPQELTELIMKLRIWT